MFNDVKKSCSKNNKKVANRKQTIHLDFKKMLTKLKNKYKKSDG